MMSDRSTEITIGGKVYDLVLTTRATKEISKRYGGLSELGGKLMKEDSFESSIDEVIFLIVLLANQSIMLFNLSNPSEKRELLTAEMVELLTSPLELAGYKEAIMNAMIKGTRRDVQSEETVSKNSVDG